MTQEIRFEESDIKLALAHYAETVLGHKPVGEAYISYDKGGDGANDSGSGASATLQVEVKPVVSMPTHGMEQ